MTRLSPVPRPAKRRRLNASTPVLVLDSDDDVHTTSTHAPVIVVADGSARPPSDVIVINDDDEHEGIRLGSNLNHPHIHHSSPPPPPPPVLEEHTINTNNNNSNNLPVLSALRSTRTAAAASSIFFTTHRQRSAPVGPTLAPLHQHSHSTHPAPAPPPVPHSRQGRSSSISSRALRGRDNGRGNEIEEDRDLMSRLLVLRTTMQLRHERERQQEHHQRIEQLLQRLHDSSRSSSGHRGAPPFHARMNNHNRNHDRIHSNNNNNNNNDHNHNNSSNNSNNINNNNNNNNNNNRSNRSISDAVRLMRIPLRMVRPRRLSFYSSSVGSEHADIASIQDMSYEEFAALHESAIREKNRARPADIEALPVRKATAADTSEKCCVCMEDVQMGESLKTLPCSHMYHAECIDKWLAVKNCCPVDKKPIGETK